MASETCDVSALSDFVPDFPPMIARKAVKWITGGGLTPKKLANDDNLGIGPRKRLKIGEQVYYPREEFLQYLEKKGVVIIDVPEL